MEVARMKAEARTAIGRNKTKHLRNVGWLPAIVYGDGKEPQPISISEWEFEQHLKHHHKVYALEIDGTKQDAYLQALKFDVLTDRPQHVDFMRIDLNKPIELDVEISFLGHPVGASKGGTLIKDNTQVRIRCLPTAIPETLEVSVAGLDLNDVLLANQIELPEGVELAGEASTPICRVSAATRAQEDTPAEGDSAEGEGSGDSAGDSPAEPKE